MNRHGLARAAPDKRHRCRPPLFVFRGPPDGTRWTCAKCSREWVWAMRYPHAIVSYGQSTWWNVEYEAAFLDYYDAGDRLAPDPDDHGGLGPSILPWFGSPGDYKHVKWWAEGGG